MERCRDRMFSSNRVFASEVLVQKVSRCDLQSRPNRSSGPRGDGHSEHEAGYLVLNFSFLNIDRDRACLIRLYRVIIHVG